MNRKIACVTAAGFALVCACSRAPRGAILPADVRGIVYLDGAPLSGGTITFLAEEDEQDGGRPGLAEIGADGSFIIGNANPRKPSGLKPGRYRVTVMRMDVANTDGALSISLATPKVYADERTTPFVREVVDGRNEFVFHLTSEHNPAAND